MALTPRNAQALARRRGARKKTVHRLIIVAVYAVADTLRHRMEPRLYHSSKLTGIDWVCELLDGHPERIRDCLGVHKHVFKKLVEELFQLSHLEATKGVTMEEQVAVFLYMVKTGLGYRQVAERFQRSNETIYRILHRVLLAFESTAFKESYLRLPSGIVQDYIRSNPKFYPFFKDAIGAIDGTHIFARPPEELRPRFRDRNGQVTMNVLAACTFDMQFCYVLSGYEGSAADGTIYEHARSTDLAVPDGKYYLADAGFSSCDTLLVPYRGVRYHLREWGAARLRPRDHEEIFNLRHSQLRNIVERIFGVAKTQFAVLAHGSRFAISAQARLVPAVCTLFNFIKIYDPEALQIPENPEDIEGQLDSLRLRRGAVDDGDLGGPIPEAEGERGDARRDEIAMAIWESYQAELAVRREREGQ